MIPLAVSVDADVSPAGAPQLDLHFMGAGLSAHVTLTLAQVRDLTQDMAAKAREALAEAKRQADARRPGASA